MNQESNLKSNLTKNLKLRKDIIKYSSQLKKYQCKKQPAIRYSE